MDNSLSVQSAVVGFCKFAGRTSSTLWGGSWASNGEPEPNSGKLSPKGQERLNSLALDSPELPTVSPSPVIGHGALA